MSAILTHIIQITCFVGLLLFRKIKSEKIRLIVIFLVIDYIVEDFLPIIIKIDYKNYYPMVYSFIKPLEIILYFYCFNEARKLNEKILLNLLNISFISICMFNLLNNYVDTGIVNIYSQIQYFIISITLILYFKNILQIEKEIYLFQSPLFVYSVGLFMFSLCNIVYSGFKIKINNFDKEIGNSLNAFTNYGLMVIRYLTLLVAIIISTKRPIINDE